MKEQKQNDKQFSVKKNISRLFWWTITPKNDSSGKNVQTHFAAASMTKKEKSFATLAPGSRSRRSRRVPWWPSSEIYHNCGKNRLLRIGLKERHQHMSQHALLMLSQPWQPRLVMIRESFSMTFYGDEYSHDILLCCSAKRLFLWVSIVKGMMKSKQTIKGGANYWPRSIIKI